MYCIKVAMDKKGNRLKESDTRKCDILNCINENMNVQNIFRHHCRELQFF